MNLFYLIELILLESEIERKIQLAEELKQLLDRETIKLQWERDSKVLMIRQAGIPKALRLVSSKEVTRRNYTSREGYAALLHSICHIELMLLIWLLMQLIVFACYLKHLLWIG